MLFTSALFLFLYLPIFITTYFIAPTKLRNHILIIFSSFFYFWAEPRFISVVFASVIADWHIGNRIFCVDNSKHKKLYLSLYVALNVALLLYFKYMNFFVENINELLNSIGFQTFIWTKIALPLGLSFIVFEKITYGVDIYKGIGKPARTLYLYMLYALLFPKLIAGPIIKYHEIENQLENRSVQIDDIFYGILRFSIGLAKKVWVADTLGTIVDHTFQLPASTLVTYQAWLGILCFTFQIYFDFSGYSDMAIGLARMAGFRIRENFNYPYISSSFTEFWHRWHISLSTWIREYLYFPLGGSKKSKGRTYFNLWLCFLISGIWHGANWTYVIWGVYHGIFLIFDKLFWLDLSKRIPRFLTIPLTFVLVMIGWVFFRATSFQNALDYLSRMFDLSNLFSIKAEHIMYIGNDILALVLIGVIVSLLPLFRKFQIFYESVVMDCSSCFSPLLPTILAICFIGISIIKLSTAHFTPFIYFRF